MTAKHAASASPASERDARAATAPASATSVTPGTSGPRARLGPRAAGAAAPTMAACVAAAQLSWYSAMAAARAVSSRADVAMARTRGRRPPALRGKGPGELGLGLGLG